MTSHNAHLTETAATKMLDLLRAYAAGATKDTDREFTTVVTGEVMRETRKLLREIEGA